MASALNRPSTSKPAPELRHFVTTFECLTSAQRAQAEALAQRAQGGELESGFAAVANGQVVGVAECEFLKRETRLNGIVGKASRDAVEFRREHHVTPARALWEHVMDTVKDSGFPVTTSPLTEQGAEFAKRVFRELKLLRQGKLTVVLNPADDPEHMTNAKIQHIKAGRELHFRFNPHPQLPEPHAPLHYPAV